MILALLLMAASVPGSLVPSFPGPSLSGVGILLYWWSTGYQAPGTLFLIGFLAVVAIAVTLDQIATAAATKISGASNRTALAAAIAGLIMLFVGGPLGLLAGIAGTVFVREFLRTGDREKSVKAAFYSTAGILGSGAVQAVVSSGLLAAFLIFLAV